MSVRHWIRRKLFWLYMKIVRENASPEYIARGWAIGMFYGCLIPFGLQLICSIPTAFLLKGSKIGATLGTLITNQVTIFFIYPAQCYIGGKLMGEALPFHDVELAFADVIEKQDFRTLFNLSGDLVISFFLGGALFALVMTPITYFLILKLVRSYRALRLKRKKNRL